MHSQENVKKIVTNSLYSQWIRKYSQLFVGIHMAFIRPYFFPTNHIIFGDFAVNFKFSYSQGYLPKCESSIMEKVCNSGSMKLVIK